MTNNKQEPLRRGVDGVCARSTCECEHEGLGDQCVWLRPTDAELERRAPLSEPKPVQETVQEPVAWMVYTLDGKSVCVTDNPADFSEQHKALPLYTAPPQRPLLTDEEIDALKGEVWGSSGIAPRSASAFARAVERAVQGEKE